MEKSVTAILVAYNSMDVIADALTSLLQSPEIATIIVVDNCSTDDTCELISKHFAQVKLIENPKNEGFGRANNVALAKVKTPYVLLVNPDAVLKEGCVSALLDAAQHYNDAAMLAPILYDIKGTMHHSYKRNIFDREKHKTAYYEPEGDLCADYLSGAVLLLSMSHMRKVGFFDPAIFLYYEDDDLCLRARQQGYGLVLVYNAHAMHIQGASNGAITPELQFMRQSHMAWSRLYMQKKYRGLASARRLAFRLELTYSLKAAYYMLKRMPEKVMRYRGRLAGISKFYEGRG